MKKTLPVLLALLFLTSCLPRLPKAFCPPFPNASCGDENSTTGKSIGNADPDFPAGLSPHYRTIPTELEKAPIYTIELEITEDIYVINGRESIQYTNTENIPLSEVQLHLYPNILGGEMTVSDIKVNDASVTPRFMKQSSVMSIPLKNELKPGQTITLMMGFNTTVAQNIFQSYGVQAYSDDVLSLAHAYPVIAVYDEEGWNNEIPSPSGDVSYADVAFYVVTVKAPKSLLVAATGQQVSNEAQDGMQILSYEAGPARDFYIAASTKFQVITKQAGDVTLSFYFKDGHKPAAQNALNIAAEALDDFGKRYAPYPYTELDFVETPTYALGIEYPGIIAITDQIMNVDDNYLEGTVAHEVGHQWFYNLVGNDQLDDPWLDESLTQFATMEYFSDEYGQRGYDIYHSELVDNWAYIGSENIAVGKPVADYTEAEYVAIVYGRGGLFFEALRSEMGAETFDTFLKEYTEAMTWKISTPDILKEYAEKNCNCDLTPLFDEWIW